MGKVKQVLKRAVPLPIWRPASNAYWWWKNRGCHQAAALLGKSLRESKEALDHYRERHQGQRCFIIGNGPSLRRTDLTFLREEVTFGLNRIYLLFPEIGFPTTYLVSVNDWVIRQCADELKALEIPKFITWRGRSHIRNDPHTIFIDTDFTQPETFAYNATGRIYEGCTVTYVAMQLAFYMGFETVILIGVDHHFKASGPPNLAVVSQGEDPDHFHPEYFGKGFIWQLPDLECSERAYEMARQEYEAHGRRILDATIDGRLSIFPKVDYRSLFSDDSS